MRCEVQPTALKIIEASGSYGLDEVCCNLFLGQLRDGAFIRLALTDFNTKLDNIMIQQSNTEKKLSDIDARVAGRATTLPNWNEH